MYTWTLKSWALPPPDWAGALRCWSSKVAGKKPITRQQLAHMGWQRRQLNQQWGISWLTRGMSEMLTAWSLLQISVKHGSISILPTIGSTFTLLCGSVCTFTPGSGLWSLYYMCRPVLLCACTTSENKGCCLMSAVVFSTEIAYLCKFRATFYKKLCIVQLYAAGLWGDRMITCALTLWLTIWLICRKKKKIQLWNMTTELLALWLFFFSLSTLILHITYLHISDHSSKF